MPTAPYEILVVFSRNDNSCIGSARFKVLSADINPAEAVQTLINSVPDIHNAAQEAAKRVYAKRVELFPAEYQKWLAAKDIVAKYAEQVAAARHRLEERNKARMENRPLPAKIPFPEELPRETFMAGSREPQPPLPPDIYDLDGSFDECFSVLQACDWQNVGLELVAWYDQQIPVLRVKDGEWRQTSQKQ